MHYPHCEWLQTSDVCHKEKIIYVREKLVGKETMYDWMKICSCSFDTFMQKELILQQSAFHSAAWLTSNFWLENVQEFFI